MPDTPSGTQLPTGPPSSCGEVDVEGISLYGGLPGMGGGLDEELADLNLVGQPLTVTQELDSHARNQLPNPSHPASQEGGPQPQPHAGATNNTPQTQTQPQHTPRCQEQYCPVPITLAEAPHIFKDLRKRQILNPHQVEQLRKTPQAHFKTASINIKGRGADRIHDATHKWHQIHTTVLHNNIALMAVQETHLSSTQAQEIQDSYIGKNLKIFSSLDPSRPNAAGIAIALNYNLVNTETDVVKTYNLIPGHALCITVPFSGKETFTSLAVYALNESMTANREFWNDLTKKWLTLNLPVPDQILGDTNIVEEAPDRSNNRIDDQSAVEALTQFKNLFHLKDGWRAINPSEQQYTHVHQGQNGRTSMS
ncbi:hypothetical protein GYMLUDRAFT_250758 [Collybiopsis luxurians FD-317 M1]|uniref:Endonuclease/exonuclease/phosphatase domain-containing protein n=1 Tax=Collybiopsis luxurians FD-317 M1 TaxID=944289 RepID=A0A0D0ARD2_9AGAR|nr:hypothetical protein GYMLUDRAFT_250758 [Collybiopsis luxurians FD-317 M1]